VVICLQIRLKREAYERKQEARREAERDERARVQGESAADREASKRGHRKREATASMWADGSSSSTPLAARSQNGLTDLQRTSSTQLTVPCRNSTSTPEASPLHIFTSREVDQAPVATFSPQMSAFYTCQPPALMNHTEALEHLSSIISGAQPYRAASALLTATASQMSAVSHASPRAACTQADADAWPSAGVGQMQQMNIREEFSLNDSQWPIKAAPMGSMHNWPVRSVSGCPSSGQLAAGTHSPHGGLTNRFAAQNSSSVHAVGMQALSAAAAGEGSLERGHHERPPLVSIWAPEHGNCDTVWSFDGPADTTFSYLPGAASGREDPQAAPVQTAAAPSSASASGLFAYGAPGAHVFSQDRSDWPNPEYQSTMPLVDTHTVASATQTSDLPVQFTTDGAMCAAFLERLNDTCLLGEDDTWMATTGNYGQQIRHRQFSSRQSMATPSHGSLLRGVYLGSGHTSLYTKQDHSMGHAEYVRRHPFMGSEECVSQAPVHVGHADEYGMAVAHELGERGSMAYRDWTGMHGPVRVLEAEGMFPVGDVALAEAHPVEFVGGGMNVEAANLNHPLNVHAAAFQARRPRVNSADLGLPNDLME
jgi:hypothetical protein